MALARWLVLAAAAALAAAEYPELTLVLQPDDGAPFNWDEITRWMEQSRFQVDDSPPQEESESEPESLPLASALTAYPAAGADQASGSFPAGLGEPTREPAPASEPSPPAPENTALGEAAPPVWEPASVVPGSPAATPGPAFIGASWPVAPGPALVPGVSQPVVPGPALVPDSQAPLPGPAATPSASPEPDTPPPPPSPMDPAPMGPALPVGAPVASADFHDLRPMEAHGAPEPTADDSDYPGLLPGQRLLALEMEPDTDRTAAVPVGGFGASPAAPPMPADMMAVLLQRLEERLVASEGRHQQQATELRAIQHRQRKEEVVDRENMEALRSEFDNIEHKVDNLQFDLGRMTSMLETILNDVQMVQRTQSERAAASTGAGKRAAATGELTDAISELSQKLGQLVVNTELLKGGQRRLGGNVRTIANQTSELSERSEDFATKVTVANSLSEMRTYLDQHKAAPAATFAKDGDRLPGDCSDVQVSGEGQLSGIYQVLPRGALQPIFVYCDMETDSGGWAVIQRRLNGEEDFFQDWLAYKYGFGNLGGEFWLGNQNIHLLTTHRLNELRVELADFPRERPGYENYSGSNATANYAAFALGSETEGYSLKILDNYSGDAGDSLKYHAGMKFSTKDMDNDLWKEDSCAVAHKGGWWYKGCDSSNLNGLYLNGPVPSEYEYQVAYWYDWRGPLYSLYKTKMMVRPANHRQRVADARKRGSGRDGEGSKTAAQRRSSTQTVRRNRRRRNRRRKQRRFSH